MRTICSRCSFSNTRSSTPLLDHRFMRVSIVCQLPKCGGSPRHLHPCSATDNNALSTSKSFHVGSGTAGRNLLHGKCEPTCVGAVPAVSSRIVVKLSPVEQTRLRKE